MCICIYDLRIIKKLRIAKGLTQEQLAELAGIDRSYISRLETENITRDRSPTLATLEKLAFALEVCPQDLAFYSCTKCKLNNKCLRKNKTDYEDIDEESLNFYL